MRIDFGYWSFGGKTMVKCHIIQCSLLHWHRMYHVFIYCYKKNKNKNKKCIFLVMWTLSFLFVL